MTSSNNKVRRPAAARAALLATLLPLIALGCVDGSTEPGDPVEEPTKQISINGFDKAETATALTVAVMTSDEFAGAADIVGAQIPAGKDAVTVNLREAALSAATSVWVIVGDIAEAKTGAGASVTGKKFTVDSGVPALDMAKGSEITEETLKAFVDAYPSGGMDTIPKRILISGFTDAQQGQAITVSVMAVITPKAGAEWTIQGSTVTLDLKKPAKSEKDQDWTGVGPYTVWIVVGDVVKAQETAAGMKNATAAEIIKATEMVGKTINVDIQSPTTSVDFAAAGKLLDSLLLSFINLYDPEGYDG